MTAFILLSLATLTPPQPFQNRTIPLAFRRASVCVCFVGFASLRSPWAHTLKASLPCLLLPLHRILSFPQPLQKAIIPRKSPSPLPPLSKGGGLTARHKLLLCCVLIAIRPPFLFIKLFCRQDGGIVTSNLSIPTTFSKAPQPPRPALNLPPLSKVRCCRSKKFWRLPEGLLYTHQPLHPHNPLNSTPPPSPRTITLAL
mgnify:CR=1 FL=1